MWAEVAKDGLMEQVLFKTGGALNHQWACPKWVQLFILKNGRNGTPTFEERNLRPEGPEGPESARSIGQGLVSLVALCLMCSL